MSSSLRKYVLGPAKIVIALVLLGVLISVARHSYEDLRGTPKNWGLLLAALVAFLASISLTFIRWYWLVRAIGLPFTMHDAFRLGFVGFALNFVSPGSVGGDLFKAVFIAREMHGRRTEAVATVVFDRLVGLYALLLLAAGAILFGGIHSGGESHELQVISRITLVATAIGGVVMVALVMPDFTDGKVIRFFGRTPFIGPTVERLLRAVSLYQRKYVLFIGAIVLSLGVHVLTSLSVYFIAKGMLPAAPPFSQHLVIVPLANLAGALPLTPSGVGTLEAALGYLYQEITFSPTKVTVQQGVLIGLFFRLITMVTALIGVYYIIRGRREVAAAIHDAEEDEHDENDTGRE